MKESKIEEKLKRTEARLNKAAEEKRTLKAKMKQLEEQAENERLVSRGKILESFLREPLVLTNGDVTYLLELLFRSSFSQGTLTKLIDARKPVQPAMADELAVAEPGEESNES